MKQPAKPTSNHSNKPTSNHSKVKRKTRAELNLEGRARKHKNKHKGQKSGNRSNPNTTDRKQQTTSNAKDPRIGSKTPVPLLAETKTTSHAIPAAPEPVKMTREQELRKLESDPRLDSLLDRLEGGEVLSHEDQTWLDARLDRIEQLMALLGIDLEDDVQDEQAEEDMYRLLKGQ